MPPLTVSESVSGMVKVINSVRYHYLPNSFYLYNGNTLQQFPEPEIVKMKRELLEIGI